METHLVFFLELFMAVASGSTLHGDSPVSPAVKIDPHESGMTE